MACRQSWPPQSLALVIRAPCVLYGEGNENVPRPGRNVCISPAERRERRPAPVAESRKPPVPEAACTDRPAFIVPIATTVKMAMLKEVIQRWAIEDTRTSWPQAHGYPLRLSRKIQRV